MASLKKYAKNEIYLDSEVSVQSLFKLWVEKEYGIIFKRLLFPCYKVNVHFNMWGGGCGMIESVK